MSFVVFLGLSSLSLLLLYYFFFIVTSPFIFREPTLPMTKTI